MWKFRVLFFFFMLVSCHADVIYSGDVWLCWRCEWTGDVWLGWILVNWYECDLVEDVSELAMYGFVEFVNDLMMCNFVKYVGENVNELAMYGFVGYAGELVMCGFENMGELVMCD